MLRSFPRKSLKYNTVKVDLLSGKIEVMNQTKEIKAQRWEMLTKPKT